uniref:Uncharacterized protein n=1 Tax=viral metagenome TaxID=1070528 RepID=A0A6C0FB29_9ZZZZ|tara:strand:+ start:469 stop:864 length:396 start_codon:yes stop_codon:yes gene_type:complete
MKLLGVDVTKVISELCTPAQVYLLLSVFAQLMYLSSMIYTNNAVVEAEPEGGHIHHYTFLGLIVNIIFAVLWVALLNYICQFKYGNKISWFLVLFPIIFMVIMFVGLISAASFIVGQNVKNKELMKQVNNQ